MTPTGPPPEKLKVLLAEDAIDQAHLVTAILQRTGRYQVTQAQDGEHAAQLLRERTWHLLITDLNLPGIDGFGLARIAKSLDPPIPVLAATGYSSPGWVDQAYRAGADDVLSKPLDRDDLLLKVRTLVGYEEEVKGPVASVLAVGGLLGDVERGCGGSLLKHRQAGETVLVLPLQSGTPVDGAGPDAARRAAERLGVRTVVVGEGPGQHGSLETGLLLERIVQETRPDVLYIPSNAEDDADRREAHRLALAAAGTVDRILAYETGTTTLDFRPTAFMDVTEQMGTKLEALDAFRGAAVDRPDLASAFALAAARYWGRFRGYSQVEPFEVLRGGAPGS